jgi:hypothetical protein
MLLLADLVGLAVEEEGSGRMLGHVASVEAYEANDVLELDTGVVLPMVEDCVLGVDVPGGRIVVARGGVTEDDLAWTRGRLVFRDAPLAQVAADLRRWYGVRLEVADSSLLARHLTASFDGEPLDRVLDVISLALGVTTQRSGDRVVLRAGTNFLECTPKDKDGFAWCYNKVTAPRRDMQAKLRAQGKSDKEVTEAIQAALKDGRLKPPPAGTMSYRYSDDPGRIKLLWVVSVPGATPESIGVSTESQRDAALKGNGKPWLMLPGTPGAHIMIPINPGPNAGTK